VVLVIGALALLLAAPLFGQIGPPAPSPARPCLDCCPNPPCDEPPPPSPSVRGVFYYPWWPEKWFDGGHGPHYLPDYDGDGSGEYYSCDSSAVVGRQIEAMQYGWIDVGISSWWASCRRNQSSCTSETNRLESELYQAKQRGFHWAIYYEPEQYLNPVVSDLVTDMEHILNDYALDPTYSAAYFKIWNRPVFFVYDPSGNCDTVNRWTQAVDEVEYDTGTRPYVVLYAFSGYTSCAGWNAFRWHRYGSGDSGSGLSVAGDSVNVQPGFWRATQGTPTQPRNLSTWDQHVSYMANSTLAFHLIVSYNEWRETTSIEPALELEAGYPGWESASGFGQYLDSLHNHPDLH